MTSTRDYLAAIGRSCSTIFEGLAVTLSWMVRRPHTIQYPDRMPRPIDNYIPEASRGILEVDTRVCTACLLCQNTCPIDVIKVDVQKGGAGQRYLTRFDINAAKCMYCGMCAEACMTNAIRHTKEFAFPTADVRQLILHYVHQPVVPYKVSKTAPRAVGEIARECFARQSGAYVPYTAPIPPADATAPAPAVPTAPPTDGSVPPGPAVPPVTGGAS
jgi:NADH-quinone oxidoreductase subunit I